MKNLKVLLEAVSQSPDNLPLRLLLAQGYMECQCYSKAKEHFDHILARDPKHFDASLGLAKIAHFENRLSEADVRLESIAASHLSAPAPWILRSQIAVRENRPLEARKFYDHALSLDPSSKDEELLEAIQFLEGRRPDADVHRSSFLNFTDVGGMEQIKEAIRMKIIYPFKNKELFRAYGKKAGGGLLLYGPPGCGKTLISRAIAGELGANIVAVGIHDILDMWYGQSEEKLHEVFEYCRRNAPAVLFFDEIDALCSDRNDMRSSCGRTLINQFLAELDGTYGSNENILVIGATNSPWHMDSAFLRPGRFDQTLFVPPPDKAAREQIIVILAKDKPIGELDVKEIAKQTEQFSGADLKYVFDAALEEAISQAMRSGAVTPLTNHLLVRAIKKIKPSTKAWFERGKNYALYSNRSGLYDDLAAYLRLS